MKLAILSDTHGLLRPQVTEHLKGVDGILHAGDINRPEIVAKLKEYAPLLWFGGTTIRNGQRRFPGSLPFLWKG